MRLRPAKKAGRIDVRFGVENLMGSKNCELGGVLISLAEGEGKWRKNMLLTN